MFTALESRVRQKRQVGLGGEGEKQREACSQGLWALRVWFHPKDEWVYG